jgi:hypothetical protein
MSATAQQAEAESGDDPSDRPAAAIRTPRRNVVHLFPPTERSLAAVGQIRRLCLRTIRHII